MSETIYQYKRDGLDGNIPESIVLDRKEIALIKLFSETGAQDKTLSLLFNVSNKTTRNQFSTVYRKLNLLNRSGLLKWAMDNPHLIDCQFNEFYQTVKKVIEKHPDILSCKFDKLVISNDTRQSIATIWNQSGL